MDDRIEYVNDLLNTLEYEETDLKVEKVIYDREKYPNLDEALDLNEKMGFNHHFIQFDKKNIIMYQVNPIDDCMTKKYDVKIRDGVKITRILRKKA